MLPPSPGGGRLAAGASLPLAPLVAQELARDVEPHTLAGHRGEARVSRPTVLPPTTPVGKEAERGAAGGFGAPRRAAAAPAHGAKHGLPAASLHRVSIAAGHQWHGATIGTPASGSRRWAP